jgi:predicted HicB family RNase H-like nuclease
MMKQEVQRVGLYVPIALHEQLRTIAFEERTSVNRLVVDAIEQALARRPKRKPKTTKKRG